jgi:hypothetical protein
MATGKMTFSDNLSPETVSLQERYISYNFDKEVFLPGDEFISY